MKPAEVTRIHRSLCARSKCEYLDRIDYSDACSFCPNGHFGRYERTGCMEVEQEIKGLGDIVAAIAQPIAKAVDRTFGTRLLNCGGCNKRKARLNKLVPL